jgi:hypothetical protein
MIRPTPDTIHAGAWGGAIDVYAPPAPPVVLTLSAPTSLLAGGYTVTACEAEADVPIVTGTEGA